MGGASILVCRPWWAAEYGPLHVLSISTEHHFERGSEQWHFVQADLVRHTYK